MKPTSSTPSQRPPQSQFDRVVAFYVRFLADPALRDRHVRTVCVATAIAAAALAWIKFRHYVSGYVFADLFLFSNALHNTDFVRKLLWIEEYAIARNFASLLQDHWQPTTLLLWPFVQLFGGGALIAAGVVFYVTPPLLVLRYLVRENAPTWSLLVVPLLWLSSEFVFRQSIDGVYGFHNDLQFPFYGAIALYLTLRERFGLAAVAWLLFVSVKETGPLAAGSFAFLMMLASVRRGERDRAVYFCGLWVFSMGWLVLALKASSWFWGGKQGYATRGLGLLDGTERFALKTHNLWDGVQQYLYWSLSFLQPAYVISTLPDFLVLIIYGVSPVLYYGLVINIFLLFGAARASWTLDAWGRRSARNGQLAMVAVLALLALATLHAAGNLKHVATRTMPRLYAASDQAIAEALKQIDLRCRVAISPVGLRHLEHAPHLVGLHFVTMAERARYIVSLTPSAAGQRFAGDPVLFEKMFGLFETWPLSLRTAWQGEGVRVLVNEAGACPGRR